jgi:C-terminal processing protease CtpA/Prc
MCVCTASPSGVCECLGTDRAHHLLLSYPDTPDEDGLPTVHDVKESSAIFGILQLGDRLIAVDDEDVTHLTATQVSKVISSKAANSVRLLRVIRTKHHDNELV